MQHRNGVSRRSFLYGSALVAGSAMLGACSSTKNSDSSGGGGAGGSASSARGSAKKPLPAPKKFFESPLLAAQAKSGTIPAVEKRLPDHPYVIPHNWVQRGKYGGKLNMVVFSSQGAASADSNREFFYGFSPLRYINDGQDIGPGIVETWTSNADSSQWTLNFRTGLKWSDGQPFTVDDVLFWWEDMVLPGHYSQTPPDECRSAKGTLVKMRKVSETVLQLTYDAPQPLLADNLAAWVKGGIGHNGTTWVLPKHYLKQFHIKYNPRVPKNWDTIGGLWEQHADWIRNPDCPTLLGYKVKSFDNNKGIVLERNPYYYAVSKDGDQLPYLDEINIDVVQNAQVIQLQVQQGKVDYCHGPFNQIDLSDVSTLTPTLKKAGTRILLWDSGSGTGSIFFLNLDYSDDKLRKLFREPKFRQAISLAFDRDTVQHALYFQTGEQTTGTMSPKAIEYQINDQGRQIYHQWRDSYKKHDPAKAKALLAELGLKDNDGDGYVEFPDGTKLTVRIDYSADIDTTSAAKDDQLVRDAEKVGLHMVRNPISPQSYGSQWSAGQLMVHTNWEASDGPNCLVNPTWLVPIESARWAPLEGQYYAVRGTAAEHEEQSVNPWKRNPPRLAPDPGGPIQKLWNLYDQTKRESDQMKRTQLVWQMTKIHISDGPFFMGCVANFPQVVITKNDLKNVPAKENLALNGYVNTWAVPCPAMYDPECYYWENPDQHST